MERSRTEPPAWRVWVIKRMAVVFDRPSTWPPLGLAGEKNLTRFQQGLMSKHHRNAAIRSQDIVFAALAVSYRLRQVDSPLVHL